METPIVVNEETSALQGVMRDTAYIPNPQMSFEQYCREVNLFVHFGKRWGFYLGDLLRYGEATFPDRYAQAIEFTGLEESTLRNAAWVAAVFLEEERDIALSFTHHMEVAGIPHREERLQWLAKAKREGWSTYQLRLARKGELPTGTQLPKLESDVGGEVYDTLRSMVDVFNSHKPSRSHANVFTTDWGHVEVKWVVD